MKDTLQLLIILILLLVGAWLAVRFFGSGSLSSFLRDMFSEERIEYKDRYVWDMKLIPYPVQDTVYADPDTVYVSSELDTIVVYRWYPNHEKLEGHVDIYFNVSTMKFTLIPDLVVQEKIITQTIIQEQIIHRKPAFARFTATSGMFRGFEDENYYLLGVGALFLGRFEVSGGLVNLAPGIFVSYKF